MKWALITILFYSAGASGFDPGTKLIVVQPNGDRGEPLRIEDYALLTRASYNNYKNIKARYEVLQRTLARRQKPQVKIRCPSMVCPEIKSPKKNRITLYAGVNQGALSVNEITKADGSRTLSVFQRASPLAGVGYSRKLPNTNFNLSLVFLYQGIYISGLGYDF